MVARRMSWLAIKYPILARQQISVLLLRLSVDLTTRLTHDFKSPLAKGWTASVASLDTIGAFNAVLPGRHAFRLVELDLPKNLSNCVHSFASNRKVCIRLDGEIGPKTDINCGLPQGFPIFSILFMLFTFPLLRFYELQNNSFGYADDVTAIETYPSLDIDAEKIGTTVNKVIGWVFSQRLTFDFENLELMHFS